jgi:hypothetical protein
VITARTIRGWCEAVSADVGGHGLAAQTYNLLASDQSEDLTNELSPEQRRTALLDRLGATPKKIRGDEGA